MRTDRGDPCFGQSLRDPFLSAPLGALVGWPACCAELTTYERAIGLFLHQFGPNSVTCLLMYMPTTSNDGRGTLPAVCNRTVTGHAVLTARPSVRPANL